MTRIEVFSLKWQNLRLIIINNLQPVILYLLLDIVGQPTSLRLYNVWCWLLSNKAPSQISLFLSFEMVSEF